MRAEVRPAEAQDLEAILFRFPEATRFEIFTGEHSERAIGLNTRLGYCSFKTVPVGAYSLVFMEKVRVQYDPGLKT